MIKWKCNFNIPDSTIQLAEVFIKVRSYKNNEAHFEMVTGEKVIVEDTETDVVIKQYSRIFDASFSNEEDIYIEELKHYENAEIV